jgi:hypothetical protein
MSRDNKGRFSKSQTIQEDENTSEDIHVNKKISGFLEKPPSIKLIIIMVLVFWFLSLVSPRLAEEFNSRIIHSYCKCQISPPCEINMGSAASNSTGRTKGQTTAFDWEKDVANIKP